MTRALTRIDDRVACTPDPGGVLGELLTALGASVTPEAAEAAFVPGGRGWSWGSVGLGAVEDAADVNSDPAARAEAARWLAAGQDVWQAVRTAPVAGSAQDVGTTVYDVDPASVTVLTGDELRALVREALALLAGVRAARFAAQDAAPPRALVAVGARVVCADDPQGTLGAVLTALVRDLSPEEAARRLAPDGPGWSDAMGGVWRTLDPWDLRSGPEVEARGARWLGEGREVWEVCSDESATRGAVVLLGEELRALVREAAGALR